MPKGERTNSQSVLQNVGTRNAWLVLILALGTDRLFLQSRFVVWVYSYPSGLTIGTKYQSYDFLSWFSGGRLTSLSKMNITVATVIHSLACVPGIDRVMYRAQICLSTDLSEN